MTRNFWFSLIGAVFCIIFIASLSVGVYKIDQKIAYYEQNPIILPPDFGNWSPLQNCTVLNHTYFTRDERNLIQIYVKAQAPGYCKNMTLCNFDEYVQNSRCRNASQVNRTIDHDFPVGGTINCRVNFIGHPTCTMFRFDFDGDIFTPRLNPKLNLFYQVQSTPFRALSASSITIS